MLGKFFSGKAIDALINKFSVLGKEIRNLNKELGLNIEPKIAKGLRGFDIPKGLNEETKKLLLLNAAIAETKLQIRQGIAKGINVGELKTSLQTLETAKPALQQSAKIDINVRAERGTQAFTRVEGNIAAKTGPNMGEVPA